MTLRDSIESDALTVFLQTDDFAETVQYWPRGALTARTIKAVVIRESIQTLSENNSETVLPMFEVHVANDATNGISSTELDCGGDQIAIPPRDGYAASRRAVYRLVTQDHGMLVLECR